MSLLILAAAAATAAQPAQEVCDNKLYQKLGGSYINAPSPIASFEGDPPEGHVTWIVRNAYRKTFSASTGEQTEPER